MIKKLFLKFRKERDLTTGSVSKAIWILALPLIVSHMLQAAFNLVDMVWVGRLGPEALAAVAMAGQVLMIVMFVMMGVSVGTTAMVARAVGARDQARADNVAMQSLILGFIGSAVFAIIGYIVSPWLLRLLGAGPEVVQLGTGYLQITFAGVIVMFYMFLISGVLQGAGDAVTPMLVLAGSTVLNIVLDPLFIFGFGFIPRLGVNGAAWATVLARGIGSLVALEILLRGRSRVHVRMKYFRMDPATILGIFRIGIPATAQMSLRGLVNLVMFAVVAGFGTYALAAYGSGQRLFMLAMMPGFALGMASGTLVGQNLGAKQPERAALSAWTTVGYYAIFMFFMCVVFVFFAPYLIMLFNNNAAVVRIGSSFLRITALGTVFIAPGLILGRSMAGAGDTVSPMIITFISLWLVQIPLAIFLSRVLGIDGIWFAILTAYLVMAFMGVFWFQLGRWKHKRV